MLSNLKTHVGGKQDVSSCQGAFGFLYNMQCPHRCYHRCQSKKFSDPFAVQKDCQYGKIQHAIFLERVIFWVQQRFGSTRYWEADQSSRSSLRLPDPESQLLGRMLVPWREQEQVLTCQVLSQQKQARVLQQQQFHSEECDTTTYYDRCLAALAECNNCIQENAIAPELNLWTWEAQAKCWQASVQRCEMYCANCKRLKSWRKLKFQSDFACKMLPFLQRQMTRSFVIIKCHV